MYRAIIDFCDLKDNEHTYRAGDEYPRAGLRVSAARIAELAGSENRMGFPLIEAVDEPKAETARKPARKRTKKE